jgi:hypothetical protein
MFGTSGSWQFRGRDIYFDGLTAADLVNTWHFSYDNPKTMAGDLLSIAKGDPGYNKVLGWFNVGSPCDQSVNMTNHNAIAAWSAYEPPWSGVVRLGTYP